MQKRSILVICIIAALAIVALAVALTGRSGPVNSGENKEEDSSVAMPNPWSEAASVQEAVEGAGLDSFTLPEVFNCLAKGYQGPALRFTEGLVEAVYQDDDDRLVFRKGAGSEDVSGDFNTYPDQWEIIWKGLAIQCSGSNGEVRLGRWYFGGNAYSLSFNSGVDGRPGLSEGDVTSLVNQIQ